MNDKVMTTDIITKLTAIKDCCEPKRGSNRSQTAMAEHKRQERICCHLQGKARSWK